MKFNLFFSTIISSVLLFVLIGCHKNNAAASTQKTLYYCSRLLPLGAWQVYKKDLINGTDVSITNDPAYNYWWVEASPNHTQLLLLRSPYSSSPDQFNYNNCELIKSNADGTNQQILLADNANGWFAFGNPHWHPSGNRILLLVQPGTATAPFYITTIDTNGTNPKLLSSQYGIDANWSPTGNKIVYVGIGAVGTVPLNFEVFTADYNYSLNQLSNSQQLSSDTTRDQDPCFSPDGSTIAFSAGNAVLTKADLVSMDVSGAHRTTLIGDAGVHGGPLNWGKDGKIYHHSIYLFTTGFTLNAFNTRNNQNEILLASPSRGYISPFYTEQ